MILTLEAIGPQAGRLGAARQEFGPEGGSIGRENSNTWVLPHTKVSGLHALISYRDSTFYIEDRSRNGVCLNSAKNRVVRGQLYPLKAGDSVFIDPYEIRVSVTSASSEPRRPAQRSEPQAAPRYAMPDPNAWDADPFAERGAPPGPSPDLDTPFDVTADGELDPLKLLGSGPGSQPARKVPNAPNARSLAQGSPLEAHYRPPPVRPAPPPAPPPPVSPWDPHAIPRDYDPLADDDPLEAKAADPFAELDDAPLVAAPVAPVVPAPAPLAPLPSAYVPPPPPVTPPPAQPPIREMPVLETPVVEPPVPAAPVPPERPARVSTPVTEGSDLAAMLAGAGLGNVEVTPELARNFGEILRVVVAGVMDVLRSRQQIKDEFRMRTTQFRPVDNNPLKFSANVEDALHNLLVKRNAAYLGPVDAFDDAFDDLRHHQIAMLAGMRVAFESMLAQFDPDRLQEQFDRQQKGSILGVPSKLRYWDAYRDVCSAMAKDPEVAFRKLFGEEFAKAYEEQLKRLKTKE